MPKWTPEELSKKLRENPELSVEERQSFEANQQASMLMRAADHKYHVANREDRTYNGKVYHSKKEAQHAQDNDTQIQAGIMSFYLTQVPFRLPGGVIYRADFVEFSQVANTYLNTCLYEVHVVDVKGYDTPVSKLKQKQVKELYGIEVEIV